MSLDTAKTTAVLRGLTQKFDDGVETAAPFYPEICTIVPSSRRDEQYAKLGGMPGVREWIGDRQFGQLRAADFVLKNKLWENSLGIEREDLEDDATNLYGPVLAEMGSEAAHHPDELLLEVLVAGETEAGFDGSPFFHTAHVWGDSGSQSNDLTYDATSHVAVTEAEFLAAYHAAREAMLNFKRDNGKAFIRPKVRPLQKLMLIVPTELELVANQAINKQLVSSGETNIVLDKPMIVTLPDSYLSSGVKFYLLNLGTMLKPFVFQARRPLQRKMKGIDDREFKDVKFLTDARYNVGYLAWWNAVLTTFN
jgi:phage major head subunit gpT-like protein